MKVLRASALSLVVLALACGPEAKPADVPAKPVAPPAPSAASVPPAPAPVLAALDVDPVVAGLGRSTGGPGTDELARTGIERLCNESIARAQSLLSELRALADKPDSALTWETTGGTLDRARLALKNASDFPALMAVAHPDDVVREKAKLCEPKIDKIDTALWLDPKIASVMKRYAAKASAPGSAEALNGGRKRFLEHTLRDFKRNGIDLDANGQKRLKELNEELTKLSLEFDTNLAESHLTVEATEKQLDGLPKEWLLSHPPNKEGKVVITTDYPDYFPVLTYAKDRKLALELYKQFENRAADKNVKVIETMLALREERAKLLGYTNWAEYILEDRLAKNP
jgi:thimet oligopeptidase